MTDRGLSRYEIEEEIGRGAMGVVYRARDGVLDRHVALKKLDPVSGSRPDSDLVERFLREAKSAARLSHPNVVQVFDVFEADGSYYIAMELLDGVELTDLIGEENLSVDAKLDIIGQVVDAIQAAHEAGVVHRDLKPANIFVTSEGRVKVTDFGIAKMLDAGETAMTQIGTVIGTPGYMSPEQIQGQSVDHRSDIFSLSILAYELLSGEVLFADKATTTALYRIVNETPPPVQVEGLPPHVWPTIARGMAKDPDQRWLRTVDMGQALRGSFSPGVSPAGVPSPPTASRTGLWIGVAAAGVCAIGLIAFLAIPSGGGSASTSTTLSDTSQDAEAPVTDSQQPEVEVSAPQEPEPVPQPAPATGSMPSPPFWGAFCYANEDRAAAESMARQAEAAGFPMLVLDTAEYSTIGKPGQSIWVVCAGPYDTEAEAAQASGRLGGAGFSGAYAKLVDW